MAEAQRVEEAREGRRVAGEPLVEDLLLQVVVDIPGQSAAMVRGIVVLRHEPPIQRPQQIELGDLRPRERMQREPPRPSAQQVGPAPLQLPGARSTEHERLVVPLDEPVHLVEQGRHLLHLVDDDGTTAATSVEGQHPLGEQPGFAREIESGTGLEQVEADGVREPFGQQRRLSRLARPPQEGRLPFGKVEDELAAVRTHSEYNPVWLDQSGLYSGMVGTVLLLTEPVERRLSTWVRACFTGRASLSAGTDRREER